MKKYIIPIFVLSALFVASSAGAVTLSSIEFTFGVPVTVKENGRYLTSGGNLPELFIHYINGMSGSEKTIFFYINNDKEVFEIKPGEIKNWGNYEINFKSYNYSTEEATFIFSPLFAYDPKPITPPVVQPKNPKEKEATVTKEVTTKKDGDTTKKETVTTKKTDSEKKNESEVKPKRSFWTWVKDLFRRNK